MTTASIPVDILNPGQVFACLGFFEAAQVLCGDAEGGFADLAEEPKFRLRVPSEADPFAKVLEFLVHAQVEKRGGHGEETVFPGSEPDPLALPIRFTSDGSRLDVGHWADGSSCESFKLYAGNRSAYKIACDMQAGVKALWDGSQEDLSKDPFGVLASVAGSFNFDPRGAWTAMGVGFSLNDQGFGIRSSPVVELLAAVGLENARPNEYAKRQVRYGVWEGLVPLALARPLLSGASVGIPLKRFGFQLDLSGKNKVVTFAQEDRDNGQ